MIQGFEAPDYTYTIVLTGYRNSGKTALLSRFISNIFEKEYISTVGMSVYQKYVSVNKIYANLTIYQLAGQQMIRSLIRSVQKRADCILLIYDISSYQSFQFAQLRFRELKQRLEEKVEFLMIGTKSDLENRKVSEDEAADFAHSSGMIFFQTSALLGENIDVAFNILTNKLIGNQIRKKLIEQSKIASRSRNRFQWQKIGLLAPLAFFILILGLSMM